MKSLSKANSERLVYLAIYLVLGFIVLSSFLSFWNRYVTYASTTTINQTEEVSDALNCVKTDVLAQLQLACYGMPINGKEETVAEFERISKTRDSVSAKISQLLEKQSYPTDEISKVNSKISEFIKNTLHSLKSPKGDSDLIGNFSTLQNTLEFDALQTKINQFEGNLKSAAASDYEWSILDNSIIQVILILLSVPILLIAARNLKNEIENRKELLKSLDENNKRYLLNEGETGDLHASAVVENSIRSFKKAFDFVDFVARGSYHQADVLLPPHIQEKNKSTLMGALLNLSEKLKKSEETEMARKWVSEGLNQFYQIVRNNQHDLKLLADKATSFLSKYMESQQASLFLLKQEGGGEYLELSAAFAFDRKKYVEKRVEIGVGLLGQTYLEGEAVLITELPNKYTSITSGLGDATPTCLLIIPFAYNEKIEAVFEIAGFKKYLSHQIEFLKKAGEFLASAIRGATDTIEMQRILQQSIEQSEILKAQEEELRQNMEELEATNEAIRRKELEATRN